MPYISKYFRPLFHVCGAGLLGIGLRALLYRFGCDDRGILSPTHPLHIACLILTAAVALYLLVTLSRERLPRKKPRAYPIFHTWSFLAGFAGGCCLIVHGLQLIRAIDGSMSLVQLVLAFGGGIAAMVSASPLASSWKRKLVCHCILCAHFAMEMLCRYQGWSGSPQLPDYVFQVLACVLLTLGTYQRMAFDVRLGRRMRHRFLSLMGLYLCLISTVGPDSWAFYLGGAFWCAASLDAQTPPEENANASA